MTAWGRVKLMDMMERVLKVVSDELEIERKHIYPDSSFEYDLGVGSLEMVDLKMALEHEFQITISEEDSLLLTDIASLVAYLTEKLT